MKICPKHPALNGKMNHRECSGCHGERMKKWYQKNKERLLAKDRLNRDIKYEYHRAWRKRNPDHLRALWQNNVVKRRRLVAAQSLAKVYASEIIKIYRSCPPGYHVDHIIPLRGKGINGLHVPWNLQYLSAAENQKKGNRCLT